jgi:hypothetical protein
MCLAGVAAADFHDGASSRAAREEAIRAIPFQHLPPQVKTQTWEIVSHPSLYRQMPAKTIECDPELYLFLLRYPEVIVNIWDLMGITQVQLQRVSPTTIKAADGAGTECVADVIHSTRDMQLIYAEGFYEGPLFRNRLYGSCVLLLRSDYAEGDRGQTQITSRLDVFVKVDNMGVDLLAKTLNPILGRSADSNFTESAAFLGKVSQAAEQNGPGVQRLAATLGNVDPAVRERFSELAATVGHRAALRSVEPLAMENQASAVVQRAIETGETPFGQPLEDTITPPAAGPLEPPRRGITLRR